MFKSVPCCPDCGVRFRFQNGERLDHDCDENNLVNHQMTKLESSWETFLESHDGQFAVYYAIRKLRG